MRLIVWFAAAEVFQDRLLELPLLNERFAQSLRSWPLSWPLLMSFRVRTGVAIETLIQFYHLVIGALQLSEFAINPLFVMSDSTIGFELATDPTDGCVHVRKSLRRK
ncbi:MAG: hypothetical protein WD069_20765 [Planctomycetales bacterium]